MKDVSQGIGGRTISFSCGSLWAYTAFKPNVSLWFYVQEDHILDKYLYLIWKASENKDILIIITGCAFRSSSIPLLRNYYTNQNLCDTFIQQSTLSRIKPPNFRFLAYKLVYLMIVVEICHSPDISTQVSVQITGSFRVCRTFFKHPMTNFVKRHCMYYIK